VEFVFQLFLDVAAQPSSGVGYQNEERTPLLASGSVQIQNVRNSSFGGCMAS